MDKAMQVAKGLSKAYSDGNNPFQIITRLAEECGELAKEVNHWERTGIKIKKYGEPSKESLASEIKNVITCALQVALYYGVEEELAASLDKSYNNLKEKGLVD